MKTRSFAIDLFLLASILFNASCAAPTSLPTSTPPSNWFGAYLLFSSNQFCRTWAYPKMSIDIALEILCHAPF